MRTIGIIGGMSWESTTAYYRLVNEGVKARLGGLHSAQVLLYSVDFAPIEVMQAEGRWDDAGAALAAAARRLVAGGADVVLLATNTMHKVSGPLVDALGDVPFIHIADPTAKQVQSDGIQRIGLLGTAYTMEADFYAGRLRDVHGLDVIVPDEAGRADVHRIIYEELILGVMRDTSRERYVQVIESLVEAGAEGVILGCTEIGLLIQQDDSPVPVFDTTRLHAEAAVAAALD